MINFITSKLLGFMPFKGWMIGLFVILSSAALGSSWLLLKAHQEIGRQEAEVSHQKDLAQQWQSANEHWAVAWVDRETEISESQKRLVVREQTYTEINNQLTEQHEQVKVINDENNILDIDLGDDYWLHINKSVEAGNATIKLPDS